MHAVHSVAVGSSGKGYVMTEEIQNRNVEREGERAWKKVPCTTRLNKKWGTKMTTGTE